MKYKSKRERTKRWVGREERERDRNKKKVRLNIKYKKGEKRK